MKLKAHTLIVVADGQRAAFFRNEGLNGRVRLAETRWLSFENAPTHELGDARPGRAHDGFSSIRSAYEQTDLHERNELTFLSRVAGGIEEELSLQAYKDLMLIAPPEALGALRNAVSKTVRGKISAEIAKDYTHTPLPELEDILTKRAD